MLNSITGEFEKTGREKKSALETEVEDALKALDADFIVLLFFVCLSKIYELSGTSRMESF